MRLTRTASIVTALVCCLSVSALATQSAGAGPLAVAAPESVRPAGAVSGPVTGPMTGPMTGPASGPVEPDRLPPIGLPSSIQDERPNIVVIMADDMRADEIRYLPRTRALIGDQGVEFRNGFSPYPLCCPARSSFLTGQYTHNHQVWSHMAPWGFPALKDAATLPVWLQDVGYDTAFVGKYLNGYGSLPMPDGSPSASYVPPGWTDWRGSIDAGLSDQPADGGTYRYFDTTLNVNGRFLGNQGEYSTRVIGRQSTEMVAELASSPRPFFLWASYLAPHHGSPHEEDDPEDVLHDDGSVQSFASPARPLEVRGMYDDVITEPPGHVGEEDVSGKPYFIRNLPPVNDEEVEAITELARQRAESLEVLDQQIADTVGALEASGELDNTIIAVTSDNGYFLGEHRRRQGKILPYDPALRVPVLIRGPGIPAGEVRSDPFLTIDFAPTFLDAAGAAPRPDVNGQSMLEVARTDDRGWLRPVLTETGPRWRRLDLRTDNTVANESGGPSPLRFSQGVRTPRYLYVEHASDERELYDVRTDPHQLTNLVDRPERRGVVRRLADVLHRLRDCRGQACAEPLPAGLRTTAPPLLRR